MPTSARLSGFTGLPLNAVTPQPCLRRPILFCLARKEWGEKRRLEARYIARWRARFLAAPRPERPVGRKADTFSIAFGADKCTTRSYRQTESNPVLLIFGILGQPQLALHFIGADSSVRPVGFAFTFTDDRITRKFSETNVCIFSADVIDWCQDLTEAIAWRAPATKNRRFCNS